MKKTFSVTLIVLFAVAIVALIVLASVYISPDKSDSEIKNASSYSEVNDVIEKFYSASKNFSLYPEKLIANDASFSKTNVQTAGIDEGDRVKTNGQYAYSLNSNGCSIVSIDNGIIAHESTIQIDGYVPYELFLYENKLVMLGGISRYEKSLGVANLTPEINPYAYLVIARTDVRIYDVSDAENPVLEKSFLVDGCFNTARLIEAEGRLVFMVSYNFYHGDEETYIPKVSFDGGEHSHIKAEDIYYYDDIATFSYLIVGEVSLDEPENSDVNAYLGVSGEIYVSDKNIFVATYDANSEYKRNLFGWVKDGATPTTRIIRMSLSDSTDRSCARVDGRVKDRYSLDEYQGYLRVATTTMGSGIQNNIFVLDGSLNKVGEITNIAEGEVIYAVRFRGDTGSLITFRTIDPYFNLDLKDPASPKISKGLKEEGVNYYIHYIGDTGYTVGVGKDSDSEGLSFNGLKVSIYDNSSGEAENKATFVLEGECYADILYDPRELLYMDNGLFAFTYQRWNYRDYRYHEVEQGLAVFSVNVEDENEKLVYRGTLTNLGENLPLNEWTCFYDSFYSYIKKAIYVDNYIYTFSDNQITSYRYGTMEKRDVQILYERQAAEEDNEENTDHCPEAIISSWVLKD